ncbi:MAG TPA: TdeIII family type II restriction endonuclease [Blastocatellia bacterium]|nr:TdeIII family type II restriction endonuclease [Blastocatellia bacterium]HMV83794.1 TdeIII family type II restriction endonuclease [Blastocatellia bacterium]HMX29296.1 TdeIII family type II restriction endonuclease [Blastocatellia bacterium]HMY74196.1 TdeIII family type II restriction endonuclease [Blastocatellia bacterium]HMZ19511.1 TdeIII family type II restriction endonuclease [Blastocatellia bacterium]
MDKKQRMKKAIQSVIEDMMERIMHKVLVEDPFLKEDHHAKRPLYAALVPDEIFKGSHFERRFVTPFGGAWERLAIVAANEGLGYGEGGKEIRGTINAERLRRIQEILDKLEHPEKGKGRVRPDWRTELQYVLEGESKKILPVTVICDVYIEDRRSAITKKYAFELKAPLPNSDQSKVSKEKILKLYGMNSPQVDDAFYALPYNPYGARENYCWSFPARWFNMKADPVVLIGNEFWEKIGGLGTYQAFIEAVNEIGKKYKDRIYREFLGIEPPADALEEGELKDS